MNLLEPEESLTLTGGDFMDGEDGFMNDGFDGEDEFGTPSMFSDGFMSDEFEMQEESNEMVVLQTRNGIFLRFPLQEIPEKKKGAVGVRGIKLGDEDEILNVYVLDAGDNETVEVNGKTVELRKLKTAKRDTKGTKVRGV